MLISEHFFLLFFFPTFILLYYIVLKASLRLSNVFIIVASVLFYSTFGVNNLPFLLVSILIDYLLSTLIAKSRSSIIRKGVLFIVIAENIVLLGYFKYFAEATLFPLGLSFITFQRISYVVDVYRTGRCAKSLLEFTTYSVLFPHLIAGPILRFSALVNSLRKRTITNIDLFHAMKFLTAGLFLKILIADRLYTYEKLLFNNMTVLTTLESILIILIFSFRIYTDFSGYSLIAIGIARLLGFLYPDNFNSPYVAKSITEFWRRWNMTLSSWLRDYVYIPLGGSRSGNINTYRNLFVTMTVAGVWHGSGIPFVMWGAIHGVLLALERLVQTQKIHVKIPDFIKHMYVFGVVSLLWSFFIVKDINQLTSIYTGFLNFNFSLQSTISRNHLIWIAPSILVAAFWSFFYGESRVDQIKPNGYSVAAISIVFIVVLMYSLVQESVPFIYFQF